MFENVQKTAFAF